jgi:hypothetical protein
VVADARAIPEATVGTIEIIAEWMAGSGQRSHANMRGCESGACTMISAFKLGVVTELRGDRVNGTNGLQERLKSNMNCVHRLVKEFEAAVRPL